MRDIVTARLVLRPITAEDVSAVLNGQRRTDWADDFPAEGDHVIARLLARTGLLADDDARRFGHRLVAERDTGTVVGGAGFFGPPQDGEVEIGYGIVPSRWRRGYATEAVRAMVADILQLDAIRARMLAGDALAILGDAAAALAQFQAALPLAQQAKDYKAIRDLPKR